MRYYIFTIILCFMGVSSSGQNNLKLLKSKWIKVRVENVNKNYHFNENDPSNKKFSSIQFLDEKKIAISLSPYDIGDIAQYELSDNQINFNNQKLNISHISDSLLVLEEAFYSEDIELQPKKFFYYQQDYLLRNLIFENKVELSNDSLLVSPIEKRFRSDLSSTSRPFLNTLDNYMPFPQFDYKGLSFEEYIQKSIDILPNKKNENTCTFSFEIDSVGNLLKIKILSGKNERLNKSILKIIKSTKKMWLPSTLTKKSLHSIMIFNFRLLPIYKPFTFGEHMNLFKDGNALYASGNKIGSIEKFSQAINLVENYVDAYFNRAAVYFELGEIEKACTDWKIVYNSGKMNTYYYMVNHCNF